VQKSRPPDNLHPWLKWEGGEVAVDHDWVGERYTAAVIKGEDAGGLSWRSDPFEHSLRGRL
jgi:hypothetical protein